MAPIEDALNTPTDPIKGSIGVFGDRVKQGYTGTKDLALSSIKNFNPIDLVSSTVGNIKDFGIGTLKFGIGSIKGISKDFNPFDTNDLDTAKIDSSISFNEEQKKLGKQFNDIGGWQMTQDIGGLVFQGIDSYLFGTDIEKNLKAGTNIRDFNSQTTEIQKSINDLQENIESIYDKPKYKELSNFYSNAYNQYLEIYGDTGAIDFETFYAQKFNQLTPQQQKRLENEINGIQNEIKTTQSELDKKQEELQSFINEHIVPQEGKTGFDIYNETQQAEQDKLQKNKYFGLIGDIYSKADEKVSNDIGGLGLKNISDFEGIDNLKSALVDNLAVAKQFELTVLGNELLPEREEIAKKIATANKAKYDFDLQFVKNYTEARGQEKYKGLSEVELRKAVEKDTWVNLPQEKKELFMSREILINQISQINEAMQAGEKLSNLNPLGLLDLISYGGVTIKRMIDAGFNYEQDVPHYVQQSNRNLIYSNEGNWDKFKSVITYNPDVILSSALSLAIAKKPVVGFEKAVTKMGQGAITKLPANVGFGKGVATFLGTKARGLTSSQIYGAGIDPILDTHLEEAPSKTLEQFNQITNLFFDVGIIGIDGTYKGGARSMNSLMYRFKVEEDKKSIVKEAVKFLNENNGVKMSEVDMYNAMEDASNIYKTLFNPEDVKTLFTEDKALYNFIMDNLKKMDEFKLKELLTEKGIGLQRMVTENMDTLYKDFKSKDVFNAYNKIVEASKITSAKTPEEIALKVEGQLAAEVIDNYEEKFKSYFTKGLSVDGFQFDSNNYKDSNFLKIKKQADELIDTIMTDIKSGGDRKAIELNISKFDKLLKDAQHEFKSNKEFIEYVEMRMPLGEPIQINLNKFNEITGVTLQEAFKNGSVTIKSKKGYKDGTYSFIDDNPLENLNMDLREYLKTKEGAINAFISEFAEKYNITSDALNFRVLKDNILIPLVFGSTKDEGGRSGTINLDFLYNLAPDIQVKAVNEFGQQLSELINGFFGKAEGYKDIKALDINSYYKNGIELEPFEMASIKDITSVTNEKEGFFNIATGVFKTKDGKYINSMYFLPGKDLFKYDGIIKAFTGYDNTSNSISGTMPQLTSSITQIKRILFSNVKKGDTMNFLTGLDKANAGYYGGVSYFKDGKLLTDKVDGLVDKIINNYNKDTKDKLDTNNIKTIKEFIRESFDGLDNSYDMFIGAMIYNLTTAYIKDSKLITEVVKNIDNANYKKLFAKLLVNDSQKQLLISRFSKGEPEVKLPESVTNIIKGQREQFVQELKVKKLVHEDNLERLNKFLEDNKGIIDDTLLQMYNTKKIEIENNIEYINKQSTTFKGLDLYTTKQFISQFLEKKLENFTDLIKFNEEIREEIQSKYTKKQTSLNEQLKKLQKVGEKNIEKYTDIINDYIEAVKKNNLEEAVIIANKIDDTNIKDLVIDYANTLKDKIVLDDFVAKEAIEGQLFESHNVGKGIFNYEEAIKDNPLLTSITSSITGNKTGDSVGVYERIRGALYNEQPVETPIISKDNMTEADYAEADMLAQDYFERSGEGLLFIKRILDQHEKITAYKDHYKFNKEKYDKITDVYGVTIKDKEIYDIELIEKGREFGNKNDKIIKDFFVGKKDIDFKKLTSDESINLYKRELELIKEKLDINGETIVGTGIRVVNQIEKNAGEIDLLTMSKDGTFNIYEFTTHRSSPKVARNQTQLSGYKNALESNGFKVSKVVMVSKQLNYSEKSLEPKLGEIKYDIINYSKETPKIVESDILKQIKDLTEVIGTDTETGNLIYKGGSFTKMRDQVYGILEDAIKGVKIKAIKTDGTVIDNITPELLDGLKENIGEVIKKIRGINRQTNYGDDKVKSRLINIKGERVDEPGSKYPQIYNVANMDSTVEGVLKIHNMINNGMDIMIMNMNNKQLLQNAGVVNANGKSTTTLGNIFDGKNKEKLSAIREKLGKRVLEDITDPTEVDELFNLYNSISQEDKAIYAIREFTKVFNRDKDGFDTFKAIDKNSKKYNVGIKNPKELFDNIGVLGLYNQGYYFAGNFGDKSSVHQFYRANKDLIQALKKRNIISNQFDVQRLSKALYEIDYAYAEGYLKQKGTRNNFQEVVDYISKVDKYKYEGEEVIVKGIEDIEKIIEQIREEEIIKRLSIKKREAAQMSNYSIIEGEDAKKPLNTFVLQAIHQEDNINHLFKGVTGYNLEYENGKLKDDLLLDLINVNAFEGLTPDKKNELRLHYNKLGIEGNSIIEIVDTLSKNFNKLIENFKSIPLPERWGGKVGKYKSMYKYASAQLKNPPEDNTEKWIQFIEGTYLKDNDDGTSFASEDVIIKLLQHEKNISYKKAKQIVQGKEISGIKAHSSEILDVNVGTEKKKQIRKISFLGKHYINTGNIKKEDGGFYNDAHFVGANSAKLDSAVKYYDTNNYKTITIGGKEYKIVGEVPGTTYGIFKNATSTLTREHDDTTISNSILAILTDGAASNIEDLIKGLIRDKYRATLQSLVDPKAEIEVWSQIDKAISNFIAKTEGVGLGSPSIIQAKINELLKYVSKVIDKPTDKGQSVFIKYSDHTLSPNEMKMGPNSELVKQMRGYSAEAMYSKSYEALDAKEKDMVDANLFTTGYRYPVPTKYNLGTYRVIVDDSLANNEVITNPLTTYIKIEGDNDGDHLFFLPTLSKWGQEISKDLLNYKGDKFFDYLSEGEWNNDFILADQIKKGKSTLNPTLLDMRLTAIDGKKRIGVVSATGRTIKLLIQMFGNKEKYKDVKVGISELDIKGNKVEKVISFSKLAERYKGLGKTDMKEQLESYASILQLTIDFGSSDSTKFDNLWYFELIGAIKYGDEMMDKVKQTKAKYDAGEALTTEEKKIFLNIVNENEMIMSGFGQKYGNDSFLNAGTIGSMSNNINKKEKELAYVLGSKGNILRDFVDNYGADINDLNKNETIQFFIDEVIPSTGEFKDWKIKLAQAAKDGYYATYKEQIPKMYEVLSKPHPYFKQFTGEITSYKKGEALAVFGNDEQLKAFYDKFDKISEKPVKYEYVGDSGKRIEINSREDIFNIFKKEFPEAKDSLYSQLIKKIDELKKRNKITPEYLDLIDKVKKTKTFVKEDEKSMYELKEEIQTKIQELQAKDTDTDKNGAIAVMLTALLLGDSHTFSLLTNTAKVKYLEYTDKKFQVAYDKIRTRRTDVITKKEFDEKVNGIEKEIKSLETQEGNDEAIKNLQSKLEELNLEYSKLEDPVITDEVIQSAQPKKDVDILLPMIQEKFIDIDTQSAQQMMYNFSNTVVEGDVLLKTKVSQFFHKYVPDFVSVYSNIRDFMNRDLIISKAVEDDIRHMQVPYFIGSRTGIMSVLKKSGISKLGDFTKEIQEAILTFEKGKVVLKENDLIIDKLKTSPLVMGTVGEKLLQPKDKGGLLEDFIKELDDYKLKVGEPVAYKINRLKEVYNYDVWSSYPYNQKKSLLSDVLTSHKSDGELALKVYGIHTEDEFIKLLSDRGLTNDGFFNKGHIKMMTSVLFKGEQDWLDKVLGFVKAFHYELTYGLTSTVFTQNGIIAGMAQILPNHLEMQSYIRKYGADLSQAMIAMNKYGFLDSENVKMFGSSLGKEQNDKSIVNDLFTRTLSLAGMNYPKTNRISSMIHMITTNPLGAGDYPVENLRKLGAILQAMQEHGFKNVEDIDKFVRLNGESFLGRFRSSINRNFAESGGGVVSASQIYRDTVFTHLHEYINIPGLHMAAKFFSQTIGYLMGWAYHKTATILEKEGAIFSSFYKLANGNTSGFKKDLNDWFQFNHGVALYTAYGLGLHMKFQKFEKDNNERISFAEFNRSFNNHFVAYEILVDRRMNNWDTAGELGTMGDQFKYTTVSEVRNVLRLFKQPKIIMDLYNHYEMTKLSGQHDIMSSIKFVLDQHYTGYGKFNGLSKQTDIYNTLQTTGIHGILGVGGLTDEEELFKKLMSGKMFNSFQDKGVFKTLLNTIMYANSDDASYGLLIQMAKNIKELSLKDPEIKKLISGGKLGTGVDDFNLNQLLGNSGDLIDNDMAEQINSLYNYISNSAISKFDVEGKIDETWMSKYQLLMKDNLDKALNKEGLTIDVLMGPGVDLEYKLQKLSDISSKYDIPHPVAISLVLDEAMRARVNEKLRREKRSYVPLDYIEAKRDIMLENQDILNLNSDFVFEVIADKTRKEYGDIIGEYEKKFKNAGFSINDGLDILNRSYLIGQVIDNDTSVAKLHSKYTLAFKGISSNQAGVDLVNNFLQGVEALPYLDKKSKLANQAAAITGMNKSLYGLLRDNDEFMKLTGESRKLLSNWMYKVGKESIQFDSNSYLNELNSTAYKPRSGYGNMIRPAYQSKSFGGARPNFGKQFEPIRQMIPNVIQDLARDPDRIIRNRNPYIDAVGYNGFKNPIMKRFIELQIQSLYRGYRSEGMIKQDMKVDSIRKRDIKLKKGGKIKDKFITKK